MFDNNNPRIVRAASAGAIATMLLLAAAAPSAAQSYDPDLGAGNTAPPGITYGGGLRYGAPYPSGRWNRSVFSHRAQVVPHRPKHPRPRAK